MSLKLSHGVASAAELALRLPSEHSPVHEEQVGARSSNQPVQYGLKTAIAMSASEMVEIETTNGACQF
jgi:hypothetical protein